MKKKEIVLWQQNRQEVDMKIVKNILTNWEKIMYMN